MWIFNNDTLTLECYEFIGNIEDIELKPKLIKTIYLQDILNSNKEIERLNNTIDEIESIVYADIPNIDVRISIQELLDKLKEGK